MVKQKSRVRIRSNPRAPKASSGYPSPHGAVEPLPAKSNVGVSHWPATLGHLSQVGTLVVVVVGYLFTVVPVMQMQLSEEKLAKSELDIREMSAKKDSLVADLDALTAKLAATEVSSIVAKQDLKEKLSTLDRLLQLQRLRKQLGDAYAELALASSGGSVEERVAYAQAKLVKPSAMISGLIKAEFPYDEPLRLIAEHAIKLDWNCELRLEGILYGLEIRSRSQKDLEIVSQRIERDVADCASIAAALLNRAASETEFLPDTELIMW